MKLSKLNPGDVFLSDSGVEFQVLMMTKLEQNRNKDKFKVRRLDTSEIFFITDLIIRKNGTK